MGCLRKESDRHNEVLQTSVCQRQYPQSGKGKVKLRHNAGQITIYIIALAKSDDQLDIFHCSLLQQRFYDKKDLFVVGLASGYGEAVDMVVALTEKVAAETGGADIKKYILDHR